VDPFKIGQAPLASKKFLLIEPIRLRRVRVKQGGGMKIVATNEISFLKPLNATVINDDPGCAAQATALLERAAMRALRRNPACDMGNLQPLTVQKLRERLQGLSVQ
jgi:hypothetical protein